MASGIGLQTPKGSGTSGYIQKNKFFVKPKPKNFKISPKEFEKNFSKEILEHGRKRRIQLKLVLLEDSLIDLGYRDDEIATMLEDTRKALEAVHEETEAGRRPTRVPE